VKPPPAAGARHALKVDVVRAGPDWAPGTGEIRTWASAALGRRAAGAELAVRVVRPAESKRLNARFRGRDLVICARVVRAEARRQRKAIKAHWAHLVIHGALHLLGYDHEQDDEARRMERREVALLKRFGISNPYRSL
jgi:probable rRNA maturation factor